MTDKVDVNSFLREFKGIASKRGVNLVKRNKNELRLNYKNYCVGPQLDRDVPGKVWIFGKIIDSEEYYIKLKISSDKTSAVCLSFHTAKHPLDYPLK